MNRLTDLPEITQRRMGGLTADARLKAKILRAADGPAPRRAHFSPALAITVAAALCIGLLAILALSPTHPLGTQSKSALLDSRSAGSTAELSSAATDQPQDVAAGSISVGGATESTGDYRNLFASERSGNYPLIMAGNAVYRMLISPTDMDDSLLGSALGEVTEYTLEPALSDGGIISNIVSAGETIYAVRDMNGAMAAAYINGRLRVFQRVSFAGAAVLGGETLRNTLSVTAQATAMELTGVGIVANPVSAQNLLQMLLTDAEYENSSFGTDDTRSLLIALDNGLIVQLMVGADTVSACGTWSCPDFFAEYAAAVASE
ncbi:MAG: hypothetical protein LLF96_09475 [Eubacteriales bacterium]|nr:hypothetical protein [Eubacteriales bacterium]